MVDVHIFSSSPEISKSTTLEVEVTVVASKIIDPDIIWGSSKTVEGCVVSGLDIYVMETLGEEDSISAITPLSMSCWIVSSIFIINGVKSILGTFIVWSENLNSIGIPSWWVWLDSVNKACNSGCECEF